MKPYKLTRGIARSERGWHWFIDAYEPGSKYNLHTSRPCRWRLQALWRLYMGAGWIKWLECHRFYRRLQEKGML